MALTYDNLYGPGQTSSPQETTNTTAPEIKNPILDWAKERAEQSALSSSSVVPSMSEALGKVSKDLSIEALTPSWFNKKEEGFDKIYSSFKDGLFKELGFVLGRDNEDLYARELGRSGQLLQAVKGIAPLAFQAHNEAWKTEAGFWGNLFKGDIAKAFSFTSDPKDLMNLYESSNKIQSENFIPLTNEQKDGSFNIGKFSTGLQQFGFTLGTSLQFLEQSGLELVAAMLLAPETGTGSIWAEMANTVRRTGKLAKNISDYSNTFKKIMKLEDQVFDAARIGKAWETIYGSTKSMVKPANLYNFTKQYNMAASEAKFEKAQSYGAYVDEKQEEFYQLNGRYMSETELEDTKKEALNIANSNGMTNTALLYFMNKMNMDNVLRSGFGSQKKLLAEAGEDIFMRTGKKGAIDVVDPFVTSAGIKTFSKDWFKGRGNKLYGWLADSAWEGVQELSQSISSDYWKEYYTSRARLSNDAQKDWAKLAGVGMNALTKAVGNQNSREGLDTFISGFIIGIPGAAWNRGIGAAQKLINKKAINEQKAKLDERVAWLNSYANQPTQIFDRQKEAYINQQEIAKAMEQAVKENNIYKYKNLNRKAFQEMVMGSYKAGKLEVMLDKLSSSLANLGDDEFKSVFGLDKSTGSKTASEYVNHLKTQALDIAKTYDEASKKLTNPFNPSKYKTMTPEAIEEQLNYLGWEGALQDYAFTRTAQKDVLNRYKEILNRNNDNLGAILFNSFSRLTNDTTLKDHISTLQKDIKSLESMSDVATPESRKSLKDKKKEFDILTKWDNEMNEVRINGEIDKNFKFNLFTDYINHTQNTNKLDEIEKDKLIESFNDLKDLYRLDRDGKELINNLNFLADSEDFKNLYRTHKDALSKAYDDIIKEREESVVRQQQALELLVDNPEAEKDFTEAVVVGDNVAAAEILDELAPKEEDVKEEVLVEEDQPTVTGSSLFIEIIKDIREANTQDELRLLSEEIYTTEELTEEEIEKASTEIINRSDYLDNIAKQGNLSDDNPVFDKAYKLALSVISQELNNNPNVTDEFVNKSFDRLELVLNTLTPELRAKYQAKHDSEKKEIIEKIYQRMNSLNKRYVTKTIDKMLANTEYSLEDNIEDVFFFINTKVDVSLVSTAVDYTKEKIAQLSPAVNNTNEDRSLPEDATGNWDIAADYLLTGGIGVVISTDYMIRGLAGVFKKATGLIDTINKNYAKQISDEGLVDLKNFINTPLYDQIISEIREAINTVYPIEVNDILNDILINPTGMPARLGNAIESRLEKLTSTKTSSNIDQLIKDLSSGVLGVDNTTPFGYNAPVDLSSEDGNIYSALREKSEDDVRTTLELTEWVGAQSGKASLREVLVKISESDHATNSERILAKTLSKSVKDTQLLIVNNEEANSGYYEDGTEDININLNEVGYTDESRGYPVETVVLHETLHLLTSEELSNPASPFTVQIKALFRAAKAKVSDENFYAFSEHMSDLEQLNEFLVEARTNPVFQNFLAKIEYSKSNKSLWEKFVQAVKDFLSQFDAVDNSVLAEVFVVTEDFIKSKTVLNEDLGSIIEEISKARDLTTLELINNKVDNLNFKADITKSLKNSIRRTANNIKGENLKAAKKGLKRIKIGKRAYYYSTKNGLDVFEVRGNKLNQVRRTNVLEPLLVELLKTSTVNKLLGKTAVNEIKELGGDPDVLGTYASGTFEEISIADRDFPNISKQVVNLAFKDKQSFYEFSRDYWKIKLANDTKDGIPRLKAKYGVGAVNTYVLVSEALGGTNIKRKNGVSVNITKNKINKLVSQKYIGLDTHNTLEEITYDNPEIVNEIEPYFEFLLSGGKLDYSDIDLTSKEIDKIIKNKLGFIPTPDLKSRIERDVFDTPWVDEVEVDKFSNNTSTQSTVSDIIYVQESNIQRPLLAEDVDVTTPPELNRASRNPNALRSTSLDVVNTVLKDTFGNDIINMDVETNEFKDHYYKVRNIINKLHEEDIRTDYQATSGLYVTVTKDKDNLRWDGTVSKDDLIIGYVSDVDGNAIVFSEDGKRVDKLEDINNKKGLDNGSNQIIYFRLPNPTVLEANVKAQNAPQQPEIDRLKKAIALAEQGKVLTGKMLQVLPGKHNLKEIVRGGAGAGKTNLTVISQNDQFRAEMNQPHVSLILNGGQLNIEVTDKEGVMSLSAVYPPRSNRVMFKTDSGKDRHLGQHVLALMVAYNKMLLRGDVTPELQEKLITFVRRIYYTGKNNRVRFYEDFTGITFMKGKADSEWLPENNKLIKIENDQLYVAKPEILIEVARHLGTMKMNVDKAWLNNTIPFSVPYIVTNPDGTETINFHNMNYKEFLINKGSLETYITEIPAQEDLKRYNSIIEFDEPVEQLEKVSVKAPSEEEAMEEPSTKTEKKSSKFKKRLLSPLYQKVLEKICR